MEPLPSSQKWGSTRFSWSVTTFSLTSPGDQTDAEGDAVSLPVDVTTNDTLTLTYGATGLPPGLSINSGTGLISGTVASLASNNGPYSVTVSASDGTTTQTQSFTWTVTYIVLTNPGEQISAPGQSVTVAVPGSDPGGAALNYWVSSGPPGLMINATDGQIGWTVPTGAAAGSPYTTTVCASDGTHTASQTFTWVVSNGAVSLTNPGSQNTAEGASVSLQINASDPAGDAFTYTAVGLPSGLSIDPSSGLISGTVDYGAALTFGSYTVSVLADNGQGATGSTTFSWSVSHTNQAPVVTGGDQFNVSGDTVSLPVDASDADGDALSYTASGLPAGLSINPNTGIISGTLSAAAVAGSPYNVTVTASDGTLSGSETFSWYVSNGVVTVTAPADQENAEGDAVSVQVTASSTSQLPLTFTASGLPAGLGINSTTGQISGTVSGGAATTSNGEYTVSVTASDSQGDSGTAEFLWIIDPALQALAVTNPGTQTNAPGDDVSLQVQATGNSLVYAASGLPAGLSIDPVTGVISGEIDYSAAQTNGGRYSCWVAVNDGSGDTASQQFTWTVTPTLPTPWVADPGLQNSQVGSSVSLQVYGGDDDGGAVSYSASGLPTGLSINPTTGLITGTVSGAVGTYSPTLTVSQGSAQASDSWIWQVSQGPAPQVLIAINNALDPSADVGLVDPSAPVPVQLTLQGAGPGLHWVTLNVSPSSASTIDVSGVWMLNGGTTTLTVTPQVVSQVANDIVLIAQVDGGQAGGKKMTNVEVKFGTVSNADTPKGMNPRIPPRTWTPFTVSLTPDIKDTGEKVWLNKRGTGDTNGDAKNGNIEFQSEDNGAPLVAKWIDKAGTYKVRGVANAQTVPGHAGNLYIEVTAGANVNLTGGPTSNKFSVAAIPISVTAKLRKDWNGENVSTDPKTYVFRWGAQYVMTVNSDSEVNSDLDMVTISEKIVPPTKATSWASRMNKWKVGGFGPAYKVGQEIVDNNTLDSPPVPTTDNNGNPLKESDVKAAVYRATRGIIDKPDYPGAAETLQYFVFADKRTGLDEAHAVKVAGSGFSLVMDIEKYYISMKRTPKENNGVQPGLADEKTQKVVKDSLD